MPKFAYSLLILLTLGGSTGILQAQNRQIAPTPPMGWNSWYGNDCLLVDDALLRTQADAMAANGMKAVGYEYVGVDACWQGKRDEKGFIHGNERFPDMKALADYLHRKGLKFGIYSSPGPKTCGEWKGSWEGSYGHEEQDAQTYADWGVDYLKHDSSCNFSEEIARGDLQTERASYKKMYDALRKTGRPILYGICPNGANRAWAWAASVGANMVRTFGDFEAKTYERVAYSGFNTFDGLERFAGPGRWNDVDVMMIGLGKMTEDEHRTHMSLWSIVAAPLFVGCDLAKIAPETLAILTNPEVIAVDQDPAGVPGHRVAQEGPLEVWMKPLSDGSKAVGMFNRGESSMPITVYFSDIRSGESVAVRDLWARKDLGTFQENYTTTVPKHGVVMLKIK